MKTKTLLIAAATLAVGAITSQAQVFSQNVVGYVNTVLPANTLVPVGTPLDDGTNSLQSLFSSLPAKSTALVWNGAGYTTITKGATWPAFNVGGKTNMPPGTGFFIKSYNAVSTNTFVGQIITLSGASVTNILAANTLYYVGSPIPYGVGLNDTNLGLQILPAKSTALIWNGAGYTTLTKGASWPTSFTNVVGGGFFIKSYNASSTWIQTLNLN